MNRFTLLSLKSLRPHRGSLLRSREGFTLLEMVISLLVGGAVLAVVFQMAVLLQTQRHLTRERSSTTTTGLQVRSSLQKSLDDIGTGLISTPNWSPVHVRTGGTPGAERDTLLLFHAASPQMRNSSQGCLLSTSPDCIRLIPSEGISFSPGELLVVGSAESGARLVQVSQVLGNHSAPCGADCALETQSCSIQDTGPLNSTVVTGSRMYNASGSLTSSSGSPCSQSYWADGRRCEETYAMQSVGQASAPACTINAPAQQTYTEIIVQNRTSIPFGFPEMSTFTYRSGAGATLRVTTQKVGFSRYLLSEGSNGESSLFRQIHLTPSGTFGLSLPVSANIPSFRADVLHQGQSEYERGTGVTPEMLSLSADNANVVESTSPGAGGWADSRTFIRGYHSIGALRVRFSVRSRNPISPKDSRHEENVFSLVYGTPSILNHGATPLLP